MIAALVRAGWRPPPLTEAQTDRLLEDIAARTERAETLGLTDRELQALQLAARGLTQHQIADEVSRSSETVKDTIAIAIRKLAADNITHAVAMAIGEGLIEAPDG